MAQRMYIVDDDKSIRVMIKNIIEDNDLGVIIGQANDGEIAYKQISSIYPDIVLIDLLLPSLDGIEIIKKVKNEINHDMIFIMISEVSSDNMITEAYEAGIEFFISKPINVLEVVTVIKRAIESQNLRNVLNQLKNTYSIDSRKNVTAPITNSSRRNTMKIYSELGITGESGCNDLANIIEIIVNERKTNNHFNKYNMKEIYLELNKRFYSENSIKTIKAIEQRIRRTVIVALNNIANIGIEDFSNYKFEKYSSVLFDFSDIRLEMDYIRGKSKQRGKINIKTFIEGTINLLKD
ncbi:response regulator [Helicovermis profundi]|uniref:Stage 0 sporulation protein A homolog n=1 Tax=Helicovermis profundi TaxID=3065157 RepID=A0AAU9ED21_9FIRM|nr:response regulator [Clostridia bacterium S502]